jgi:hypothetical protein
MIDDSIEASTVKEEDLIDTSLVIDIKKYHFLYSARITFLLIQITLFIQCVLGFLFKKLVCNGINLHELWIQNHV